MKVCDNNKNNNDFFELCTFPILCCVVDMVTNVVVASVLLLITEVYFTWFVCWNIWLHA